MKRLLLIAVLVLALAVVGCTSPCQYMRSSDETEANLNTVRSRKNSLEQEVKSLRDLNDKLIANADSLAVELQGLREMRGSGDETSHARVNRPDQRVLDQQIKDLAMRNRDLREESEAARSQNKALKATVARYQKELKELQHIPSFTDLDLKRIR